MTQLNQLQLAIQSVAGKPPDPSLAGPVDNAAGSATSARFQVTSPFPPDMDKHVDKQLADLLQDPITRAQDLVKGLGAAGLNRAGAQFCAASAFSKFPFNPRSQTDASLQEVNQIFRPTEGSLWKFYDTSLKQYLSCTASGCIAGAGAPLTPQFVTFMTDAVRFSKALYGDTGTDPTLKYTIRPQSDQVESFTITLDGASTTLKPGQQGPFTWSGASNSFGVTTKNVDGTGLPMQGYDGLWAAFKFFWNSDNVNPGVFTRTPRAGQGNQPYRINGKPLSYQLFVDTHGAPAVFDRNFWQQLKCVSTVAK